MKDDRDNDVPPPPPPGLYAVPRREDPEAISGDGEGPSPSETNPPKYLIEPRLLLAGGLHLLGGAPHAGKSTLLAQILRQFVAPDPLFLPGVSFARLELEELGVILTDRPWEENSYWLRKVGLGDIPRYSLSADPEAVKFLASPLHSPVSVPILRFCLARLPQTVKFLAVDVLTNYLAGPDIFKNSLVALNMNGLRMVAKERGITILGTCYGNKLMQGKNERYQSDIDRIVGAPAFRGAGSSTLFIEAERETSEDYQRFSWLARDEPPRTVGLSRVDGLFAQRTEKVLQSTSVQESPTPLELPAPRRRGPARDPGLETMILALTPLGVAVSRPGLAQELMNRGAAKTSTYQAIKRLIATSELAWDEETGTVMRLFNPPLEPTSGEPN